MTIMAVGLFLKCTHKRAKVVAMQEQDILQKSFKDAEMKGLELPDDLKKVKSKF